MIVVHLVRRFVPNLPYKFEVIRSNRSRDVYRQQLDRLKHRLTRNGQNRPTTEEVLSSIRTTPGTFASSDSPETLGAWLGSFNASTMQSRPGTKRLPFFSHCKTS
ncbi:hypothetical protein TNCV_1804121 [Trichonephila clavipes]|nr:hypothetical protein TNCV_1804121 [Trichonephila clavipes]